MFTDPPPFRSHVFDVGRGHRLDVREIAPAGTAQVLALRARAVDQRGERFALRRRVCRAARESLLAASPVDREHDPGRVALHLVPGAGHDPSQPAMAAATAEALTAYADHAAWPQPPAP